jgi:hypothetical protein
MMPARHGAARKGALLTLAAALLLLIACDPKRYHTITRIEPDGRVYRSIYQPLDDSLPPEAVDRIEPPPDAAKKVGDAKNDAAAKNDGDAKNDGSTSGEPAYRLTETWAHRWQRRVRLRALEGSDPPAACCRDAPGSVRASPRMS